MEIALKHCPFCGHKGYLFSDNGSDYVICTTKSCCIYTNWISPDEWNSRPIEDKLHKRVAELEWFLQSHFDTTDISEAIHNMYE